MSLERHAVVGDLIIRKGDSNPTEQQHWTGVVSEVKNVVGHFSVFISWTSDPPPDYNPYYGYCHTTIHNLVSRFDVIKNKR